MTSNANYKHPKIVLVHVDSTVLHDLEYEYGLPRQSLIEAGILTRDVVTDDDEPWYFVLNGHHFTPTDAEALARNSVVEDEEDDEPAFIKKKKKRPVEEAWDEDERPKIKYRYERRK